MGITWGSSSLAEKRKGGSLKRWSSSRHCPSFMLYKELDASCEAFVKRIIYIIREHK